MSHGTPILATDGLRMHFPVKGGIFRSSVAACKAVDGVSAALAERIYAFFHEKG